MKELSAVFANVSEALENEGLALNARGKIAFMSPGLIVDEILKRVEDTLKKIS